MKAVDIWPKGFRLSLPIQSQWWTRSQIRAALVAKEEGRTLLKALISVQTEACPNCPTLRLSQARRVGVLGYRFAKLRWHSCWRPCREDYSF